MKNRRMSMVHSLKFDDSIYTQVLHPPTGPPRSEVRRASHASYEPHTQRYETPCGHSRAPCLLTTCHSFRSFFSWRCEQLLRCTNDRFYFFIRTLNHSCRLLPATVIFTHVDVNYKFLLRYTHTCRPNSNDMAILSYGAQAWVTKWHSQVSSPCEH